MVKSKEHSDISLSRERVRERERDLLTSQASSLGMF